MVKVIAEIGINHAGDIKLVKELIKTAKASGADAVKFQYRKDINNFFTDSLEMGSTLIKDELIDISLSDEEYLMAFDYAKNLDLQVGVSFFRVKDIKYLCKKFTFDFIKIPSAECLNIDLIQSSQEQCQTIMVSTGGASGEDIDLMSKSLKFRENDIVFYCISNYPVALDSIHFDYLQQLKDKFKCLVGYSSHDEYWEVCLPAIAAGADCIERHICLDKEAEGLDISSSSNPQEFKRLSKILKNQTWNKKVKLKDKTPNQGEVQNIKDLGSGYYFITSLKKGEIVTKDMVEIKSPCRGIKVGVDTFFGKSLTGSVLAGSPLVMDDFDIEKSGNKNVEWANSYNIGLPIRFNDMYKILENFQLPFYEFHMSYNDVLSIQKLDKLFWDKIKSSGSGFSIHLPDYISQKHLVDPLSDNNSDIYIKSHYLVKACVDFAIKLEKISMKNCPIIGSFSKVHGSKEETYYLLANYIKKYGINKGGILPQFLPKRAWYFGGAVELNLFCHLDDKKYFYYFPDGICLDTAHLVMACNSARGDQKKWLNELLQVAGHLHIADAAGVDGEGINFGDGELKFDFFNNLPNNIRLIIEQWEGHLNNFKGFNDALLYLERLK